MLIEFGTIISTPIKFYEELYHNISVRWMAGFAKEPKKSYQQLRHNFADISKENLLRR